MSALEDRLRLTAIKDEARRLGYRITPELLLPVRTEERYRVFAHLIDDPSIRFFLCGYEGSSIDAMEAGLQSLREGRAHPV